eukprot:363649-Chlamydomonas_euryale.AAC.11
MPANTKTLKNNGRLSQATIGALTEQLHRSGTVDSSGGGAASGQPLVGELGNDSAAAAAAAAREGGDVGVQGAVESRGGMPQQTLLDALRAEAERLRRVQAVSVASLTRGREKGKGAPRRCAVASLTRGRERGKGAPRRCGVASLTRGRERGKGAPRHCGVAVVRCGVREQKLWCGGA